MKLLSLKIINFKGITDLIIYFNGKNTNIYGENATGKTTIADAPYWLLFGKDIQEKADFAIRPINMIVGEGDEYQDTSVIGIFANDVNNDIVKLQRILKPKYNKDNKLSGFTTKYKIKDEPVKEKDYKKYIENLCDPITFKILSNPFYFSTVFPWLDRRRILFSLFKDLPTDLEIIQQNEKLSPILSFVDKQTKDPASSAKKILKDQKKELQKKQKEIPVSIKALKKILILEKKEEDSLEITQASIQHFQKNIDNLKARKLQLENNSGLLEKKSELKQVQFDISQFIQGWESQTKKQISKKDIELKKLEADYEAHNRFEAQKEKDKKALENKINNIVSALMQLRHEWTEENKKPIEAEHYDIKCPQCEFIFIPDDVRERLNKNKSENLEKISEKGLRLDKERNELQIEFEKTELGLKNIEKIKEKINNQCKSIEKQIEKIKENTEKYIENEKYKELSKKETELQGIIQKLSLGDNKEEIQEIQFEIEEFEKLLNEANEEKASIKKEEEIKRQIKDYLIKEKQVADQLEDVETKLILLNEFLRIKVSLIEDRVNDRFKLASFKLFKENLTNDEVEEICEVTDKEGIPFEKGLNHSARMNVGSDIINVLSGHYGFYPIIFYDNAEASTNIIDTKNQQVRLYVTSHVESIKSMINEFPELTESFGIKILNNNLLQTEQNIDEIIKAYKKLKGDQ